jgi:multidrug efflux system outer membrane protein
MSKSSIQELIMKQNSITAVERNISNQSREGTQFSGGGGFRAAKTSAACGGATPSFVDALSRSEPPAITRAEFSQRENCHLRGFEPGQRPALRWSMTLLLSLLVAGCASVGPDYEKPTTEAPTTFKAAELGNWKEGQPLDHLPKGEWWTVFGDDTLNSLEAKALQANQELKAAFAAMNQARATARVARSEFFPTLDANPSFRRERFSPNQNPSFGDITANTFRAPLDLSYEVDLWGRVRRGFESARAEADASAAAFHNLLLTLQADVAQNYFSLRATDEEIVVLQRSLALRREQVDIVRSRFDSGLGTELDVARAETELATAEGDVAALTRRRTELENALAILVGEAPSSFKLASQANATNRWEIKPPVIPAGLPSELLERRPDIAEAERQLAADNARIGVAKAAFFPAVRLTASGGYLSAEAEDLFDWDSRIWSFGPSVSLPIFAGGRNAANLRRAQDRYNESVARYRQRVLVAFGEVENALAGIRWLEEQAAAQQRAVVSAGRAHDLARESFTIGITDYLDVIDSDRAALQTHRTNLQLTGQRLNAVVQLIKALGGGWSHGPQFAAIQPAN